MLAMDEAPIGAWPLQKGREDIRHRRAMRHLKISIIRIWESSFKQGRNVDDKAAVQAMGNGRASDT